MMFDQESLKTGITILATFSTTMIGCARWFNGSIDKLNSRINTLSESIAKLDKNLAVQTAIFENYITSGCKYDNHDCKQNRDR